MTLSATVRSARGRGSLRTVPGASSARRPAPGGGKTFAGPWSVIREQFAPHRPHHDAVLRTFEFSGPQTLCDAIIVPSSRGVSSRCSGIALAARLAAGHGCPLLVVVSGEAATTSGRAHIGAIAQKASRNTVEPIVVDVSDVSPQVLQFEADRSELAAAAWEAWPGAADTALKRNVGMLLARRADWKNVLFLDDDIVAIPRSASIDGLTLDANNLSRVMGALEAGVFRVVGWMAVEHIETDGHTDNSLVCDIRRCMGHPQGVFLGGGALAVRVDAGVGFFPRMYNEDWLFCIHALHAFGYGCLAIAGEVTQDPPQSLYRATRAVMEEPGDILAEALMNLMHAPGKVFHLAEDRLFWARVVHFRSELVADLLEAVQRRVADGGWGIQPGAAEALLAAMAVHERMASGRKPLGRNFQEYVRCWLADGSTWRTALVEARDGRLPEAVQQALDWQPVHLPHAARLPTQVRVHEGQALAERFRLASLFTAEWGGGWAGKIKSGGWSTSSVAPIGLSSRLLPLRSKLSRRQHSPVA